jgi:hypothetical protein
VTSCNNRFLYDKKCGCMAVFKVIAKPWHMSCHLHCVLRRQDLPPDGGSSSNQGIPGHRTYWQGAAEVFLGEQVQVSARRYVAVWSSQIR